MPTHSSKEGGFASTPDRAVPTVLHASLAAAAGLPSVSATPTPPPRTGSMSKSRLQEDLTHFAASNRCLPPHASCLLHLREGTTPAFQQATFACRCSPPGCLPQGGGGYAEGPCQRLTGNRFLSPRVSRSQRHCPRCTQLGCYISRGHDLATPPRSHSSPPRGSLPTPSALCCHAPPT